MVAVPIMNGNLLYTFSLVYSLRYRGINFLYSFQCFDFQVCDRIAELLTFPV